MIYSLSLHFLTLLIHSIFLSISSLISQPPHFSLTLSSNFLDYVSSLPHSTFLLYFRYTSSLLFFRNFTTLFSPSLSLFLSPFSHFILSTFSLHVLTTFSLYFSLHFLNLLPISTLSILCFLALLSLHFELHFLTHFSYHFSQHIYFYSISITLISLSTSSFYFLCQLFLSFFFRLSYSTFSLHSHSTNFPSLLCLFTFSVAPFYYSTFSFNFFVMIFFIYWIQSDQ